MDFKYKASVIIPTYNREFLLKGSLESLNNQSISSNEYEVIICDDGSSDGTYDMLSKYMKCMNIKYLFQEDQGFRAAKARNMGISNSQGEICIFIDSGIVLDFNFIERHIESHNNSIESVTIGYVYGFNTSNKNNEIIENKIVKGNVSETIKKLKDINIKDERESFYESLGDEINSWPAPWIIFWTCNVSIKTNFLKSVGGFDEHYTTWGGEDIDLGIALYRKNGFFKLERSAIAIHYPHEKINNLDNDIELFLKRGLEKRRYMYKKYCMNEIILWYDILSKDLNKILIENNSINLNNTYDLLLTDMDGTLLDYDNNISKKTVDAIKRAQLFGKRIAISSGRDLDFISKYLSKYNLNLDIIALNGAYIKDKEGNMVFEAKINDETVYEILDRVVYDNVIIKIYSESKVYINNPKKLDDILEGFALFRFKDRISDGKEYYYNNLYNNTTVVDSFEKIIGKDINIYKIEILTANQDILKRIYSDLCTIDNIEVTSSYINNLEIMKSNTNKGEGLRRIADWLGISCERVIAVGDGLNDLEMLKVAGLGVAVSNANKKVIKQANYITKNNSNDGVEYVIKNFLL